MDIMTQQVSALETAFSREGGSGVEALLAAAPPDVLRHVNHHGETWLHRAITANCGKSIINQLLPRVPLAQRNEDGFNALDLIIKTGKCYHGAPLIWTHVAGLLQQGLMGDVEQLILGGWTAWPIKTLPEAISFYPDAMKYLAGSNMDMMPTEHWYHKCVVEGDLEPLLSQPLVALRAARDPLGLTLLHRAVLCKERHICEALVNGDPENILINAQDNMGRTPLHYAVEEKSIYEFLIEKGCDTKVKDKKQNLASDYADGSPGLDLDQVIILAEFIFRLPEYEVSLAAQTEAAKRGDIEAFLEFTHPECLQLQDATGLTALHKLVLFSQSTHVEQFIDKYNDLTALLDTKDFWGRTALHYAAALELQENNGDMYRMLDKTGSEKQKAVSDFFGKQPSDYKVGSIDVLNLSEFKSNITRLAALANLQREARDLHSEIQEEPSSPRFIAKLQSNPRLMQVQDHRGLLPTHKAALWCTQPVLNELRDSLGGALNTPVDHLGRTFLHYMASRKEIYTDFRSPDANQDNQDTLGMSPRDYAADPSLLHLDAILSAVKKQGGPRLSVIHYPTPPNGRPKSDTTRSRSSRSSRSRGKLDPTVSPTPVAATSNPPHNQPADSNYLMAELGEVLQKAMADIVQHHPHDPIDYLAHYLYKHAKNIHCRHMLEQQTKQFEAAIAENESMLENTSSLKMEQLEMNSSPVDSSDNKSPARSAKRPTEPKVSPLPVLTEE